MQILDLKYNYYFHVFYFSLSRRSLSLDELTSISQWLLTAPKRWWLTATSLLLLSSLTTCTILRSCCTCASTLKPLNCYSTYASRFVGFQIYKQHELGYFIRCKQFSYLRYSFVKDVLYVFVHFCRLQWSVCSKGQILTWRDSGMWRQRRQKVKGRHMFLMQFLFVLDIILGLTCRSATFQVKSKQNNSVNMIRSIPFSTPPLKRSYILCVVLVSSQVLRTSKADISTAGNTAMLRGWRGKE